MLNRKLLVLTLLLPFFCFAETESSNTSIQQEQYNDLISVMKAEDYKPLSVNRYCAHYPDQHCENCNIEHIGGEGGRVMCGVIHGGADIMYGRCEEPRNSTHCSNY